MAKAVAHMQFVNADPGYKGTAALAVGRGRLHSARPVT